MQSLKISFLLLASCIVLALGRRTIKDSRNKRVFSLFNVVNFDNAPCTSTTLVGGVARIGTCFTSSECANKNGEGASTCAAGFGVCCVFSITSSSGTVTQNCTYLQNPAKEKGYPGPLTSATPVNYDVQRTGSDVCFLRLDFLTFDTHAQNDPDETAGSNTCLDSFTITSPGITRRAYPIICGQNTGQHVYVDFGQGQSTNINLAFAFSSPAPITANWDIKASQIECGGVNTPPTGCFQWHTENTGTIMTFNYADPQGIHLQDHAYSSCIRQNNGYCCVEYSLCDPTERDSFSLSGGFVFTDLVVMNPLNIAIEDNCFLDYIRIPGGMSTCSQIVGNEIHDKFCGHRLNTRSRFVDITNDVLQYVMENIPICDCTPPFAVDVFTDNLPDNLQSAENNAADFPLNPGGGQNFLTQPDPAPVANTLRSRGVCLNYKQVLCA